MARRLFRSRAQRILGGVCGGFAEYFDVDVVLVRLLWALSVLLNGAGLLAYLVCWIVIPVAPAPGGPRGKAPVQEEPETAAGAVPGTEEYTPEAGAGETASGEQGREKPEERLRQQLAGIMLIILGLCFFAPMFLPRLPWRNFWPLVLVVAGIALLWQGRSKGGER